ncbi:MAG: Cof-type HAD-IIB family hydrolase [Rubrobacteraceae bacterium]|nr:Cof-type HAD-IIB family hydrolase [Rubrobacteraceae bacterium]
MAVARDPLPFDLVAFDLDGTVLRRDLEITDRTVSVVGRLREAGVRVLVATGRHFEGAREHAARLGLDEHEPIICYGGSMVRRMDASETLLLRAVPTGSALDALRWAAERGLHARVFLDGRIVTGPETPAVVRYMRRRDEPNVEVVDDLSSWLVQSGERPLKLVFVDGPDEVERWLGEARDALSGELFVTRSLPHYVELGNPEGTKAAALDYLCRRFGVEPSRVAAFGDADNDVDMLRFAGLGVAVGGMTGEVRAAADVVVPPVGEDGVARFLEELI